MKNFSADELKSINYCDYDAIVLYHSGEFNKNYETNLEGKIIQSPTESLKSEADVDSFKDRDYKTYITKEKIILYRLFGKYMKAKSGAWNIGFYLSTEFAESIIDAKIRLALDPKWENTKMYEAKVEIPAGATINIGIVAPIVTTGGTILPGGAKQIYIKDKWSEDWIQGYRRVTARQLVKVPTYNLEYIPEPVSKSKLYGTICPLCGNEDIVHLEESEQFEIRGINGGKYIMKKHCLNEDCEYYW